VTISFSNNVLHHGMSNWSEEVAGGWRRLHNEELRSLYAYPNIIRVIKWRRVRWAGHVARMVRYEKFIEYFGWETLKDEISRKT